MILNDIFYLIILFYSIIFHEIAHGYAAYRNGDKTAFYLGRLTLNPLKHIDFIGSIVVPLISYFSFGFPFGWAKPVPYNPNNIKHKKYGELEVASAGILVNFFIAFLAILVFYILKSLNIFNPALNNLLQITASVNIFLGLFNLLPFPPADGFSIWSELYIHLKDIKNNFLNLFRKNKIYNTNFVNKNQNFQNGLFKIKSLFSNPFLMILIIFIAVQVFHLLVPFILSFINWLFSF